MNIATRIIDARECGVVIAGVRAYAVGSVSEAAQQFELFSAPGIYREIDAVAARQVLAYVLHRDMAYGLLVMPSTQADALADAFVTLLAEDDAKFYTNGDFGAPDRLPGRLPQWQPATSATFDTGVLAVARTHVACVWVMDED